MRNPDDIIKTVLEELRQFMVGTFTVGQFYHALSGFSVYEVEIGEVYTLRNFRHIIFEVSAHVEKLHGCDVSITPVFDKDLLCKCLTVAIRY